MQIVSWNVRGLNDGSKRLMVRHLLKQWKVDLVCLQETKLQSLSRGLIRSLWGGHHVDWLFVGSNGASGGILLLWDNRSLQKIDEALGLYTASCKFRSVSSGFEWAFTGVYGPHDLPARRILWDEMSGVVSWWDVPWIVGGDFNIVRYPSERVGAEHITNPMQDFTDFIFSNGLMDIPMAGGQYTWSNNNSRSRLDRFLFSPNIEEHFTMVSQRCLPRLCSDHFPILLECGPTLYGRSPFRFENMWLKSECFHEKVQRWWESYVFQGSPSFVLACKLRALKQDLKIWNEEEFGNIDGRKNSLLSSVKSLDELADARPLSDEELVHHDQERAELERIILMDEICWRQKSRALWLKEGDRNTKYFHRIANSHRRKNSIGSIIVDGETITDPAEINGKIVDFYSTLFTESGPRRPTLDDLTVSTIDESDVVCLDRAFTEEEVFEAVKHMNGDKAPGPDGFSLAFFQACWGILKTDLMQVFHQFHEHGTFEKSINATFIALIPKKPGAMEMKDFRPISLISGVYKIVAKVLANRLKVIVGKVVSAPQNAFVQGRQILDSVLIANECLDSRLRSGVPGVVCKLDLEKAYDHVHWGFLLYMLRRCGFTRRWRRWIFMCISTARFSVLINGTPCGFFASSRGLRQGDPLSPLLFILVMEALSRLLFRAREGGFISGYDIGQTNFLSISHLLFADDTLILCGADSDQLWHLKGVFVWFQAASGLKINLSKSELVPVGNVPDVEGLAAVLGCKVAELPIIYLGLPLGSSFKDQTIWNGIIEKTEKRLAGWKRMYLSKGGRLTLIKSTLSNLPTYYLSLFPIPRGVAHRIEKIQRDFLWEGMGGEFKYHLVNWDRVCTPIQCGGLGIRNLVTFNQALLGKWLWRYATEREALWRKIVELKYGSMRGGWCSTIVQGTYGTSLWKTIRKGWPRFAAYVSFKVGNGALLSFWQDHWCGDTSLMVRFPELYRIASHPVASIQDLLIYNGTNHQWDVNFTRLVHDWELESVADFLDVIYSAVPRPGESDNICWNPSSNKVFSVNSYYKVLTSPNHRSFPWKRVWKSLVPSKINFFVWTAVLGKVLTIDNLRKRQLLLIDWCCMCKASGESIDHLFLHCPIARDLWSLAFSAFGVWWVMPCHVLELLLCWSTGFKSYRSAHLWDFIPHCVMWVIWRERNARSFEDTERTVPGLKQFFLTSLFEWANASGHYHFLSVHEMLSSCCFSL